MQLGIYVRKSGSTNSDKPEQSKAETQEFSDPGGEQHVAPDPEEPPGVPMEAFLEGIECRAIMRALELERWNRTAAQRLGTTFRSLRCRVKKLGVD